MTESPENVQGNTKGLIGDKLSPSQTASRFIALPAAIRSWGYALRPLKHYCCPFKVWTANSWDSKNSQQYKGRYLYRYKLCLRPKEYFFSHQSVPVQQFPPPIRPRQTEERHLRGPLSDSQDIAHSFAYFTSKLQNNVSVAKLWKHFPNPDQYREISVNLSRRQRTWYVRKRYRFWNGS